MNEPNVVSRFVKMIDQFYDHRVRIIITSEVDVNHLFDMIFDKEKELEKKLTNVVLSRIKITNRNKILI